MWEYLGRGVQQLCLLILGLPWALSHPFSPKSYPEMVTFNTTGHPFNLSLLFPPSFFSQLPSHPQTKTPLGSPTATLVGTMECWSNQFENSFNKKRKTPAARCSHFLDPCLHIPCITTILYSEPSIRGYLVRWAQWLSATGRSTCIKLRQRMPQRTVTCNFGNHSSSTFSVMKVKTMINKINHFYSMYM